MTLLALDTASPDPSLALLADGDVLGERRLAAGREMAVSLIPGLQGLLGGLALALGDIGAFAAAVGPGPFTAIRVGLATLKGLAFAGNRPLLGVGTLEAMAAAAGQRRGAIVPLLAARHGEWAVAAYRLEAGRPQAMLAPRLCLTREIPALLAPLAERVFIGRGARECAAELGAAFPAGECDVRPLALAATIGRLAWERLGRGIPAAAADSLQPAYIRRPVADCPGGAASANDD